MTKVSNEEQSNNANLISISNMKQYGECCGWNCPVCDEIIYMVGDLRNPAVIIRGEKMCDDCKSKLRKIIGK